LNAQFDFIAPNDQAVRRKRSAA